MFAKITDTQTELATYWYTHTYMYVCIPMTYMCVDDLKPKTICNTAQCAKVFTLYTFIFTFTHTYNCTRLYMCAR